MIPSFMLNTTIDNLPCSIFYDMGNEAVIPHWHKEIEIIMCDKGNAEMIINNKRYVLNEGDIGVAISGDVHSYGLSSNHTRVVVLFDLSLFEGEPFNLDLSNTLRQQLETMARVSTEWDEPTKQLVTQAIKQLVYIKDSNEYGRTLDVWARLCDLILLFCNSVPHDDTNKSGLANYNQIKMIECIDAVFKYIALHYREKITLDDAAKLVNFNTSYFARYFHKATGTTFIMYLNSYRVSKARQMLINTNKSISEISGLVGFGAVKSFNRVFKQLIGMSPNEFRKNEANNFLKNKYSKEELT